MQVETKAVETRMLPKERVGRRRWLRMETCEQHQEIREEWSLKERKSKEPQL